MSLLNSEATKEVLLEEDILSTSGRVQSIWNTFTANMNPNNDDHDLLQLIISNLRTKFIDNLSYGYSGSMDLERLIGEFQDLVDDVCKNTDRNVLSVFLLALSNALTKSLETKNQSSSNIEINMTESSADVSFADELTTVSLMERHGLLDSNQLQSLIDDRSLALTKACTDLSQRLGTPIQNSDSGEEIPPLELRDFIPNFDTIIDCIRGLCKEGVDRFPESNSELLELLKPSMKVDERRLYHPKSYHSNLANSKILVATLSYIEDSLEADASTAMYALSSIDNELNRLNEKYENVSPIVFSQLVVKAVLLKIILKENADVVSARDVLTEDYLKYTHVVGQLSAQIEQLLNKLDNSSVLSKTNLFREDQLDEYVNFVRNSRSWDAEDLISNTRSTAIHQGFQLSGDELVASLDEILSSLDEITCEIEKYHLGENAEWDEDYDGIAEALSSPINKGSEQATALENGHSVKVSQCSLVVESAKSVHAELNQCLLDRNFEGAANGIAREKALDVVIKGMNVRDKATMAELQSIMESIERDVSTYTGMLEQTVPGGISKYEESATSYIHDVLKTDNLI